MSSAYWRITNNCNIKCKHCCYNCGPGKETMSKENIEKVVDHLPKNIKDLEITGGEVFTIKPTLYHTLSYLQSKKFQDLNVIVQTNGFWVTDEDSTYEVLKELYDLGVKKINFTSDDEYHIEQGINTEKLKYHKETPIRLALKKLKKEERKVFSLPIKIGLRGAKRIYPFGRGKSFPKEKLRKTSWCLAESILRKGKEHITIDPAGQVYPCCFGVTPSLGCAINTPLEELFEKARESPILTSLSNGGLQKVVEDFKIYPTGDYVNNPCASCEEVFSELRETRKIKQEVGVC